MRWSKTLAPAVVKSQAANTGSRFCGADALGDAIDDEVDDLVLTEIATGKLLDSLPTPARRSPTPPSSTATAGPSRP